MTPAKIPHSFVMKSTRSASRVAKYVWELDVPQIHGLSSQVSSEIGDLV